MLCVTEGIIPALESSHAISQLPKLVKRYGKDESIIFSLVRLPGQSEPRVYLGDDETQPLSDDHARQAAEIAEHVETALASNRQHVLIKADRAVHYRDVARVAAAVGQIDGVQLHFAVSDPE